MLKIFGRHNSYNVQKVLWTIGEIGMPCEHVDIGRIQGQLDTPEFLALNPHVRIPVLVDDETIIWESNTIIRYLSASYAAGSLWPEIPTDRSHADRWMNWEFATIQPDFLTLFWSFFRTPAELRDNITVQQSLDRCEQHYQKLDSHPSKQSYMAGDSFTIGNIPCATSLFRYFEKGLSVSRLPNVVA
jgi:glutathione S-transferase